VQALLALLPILLILVLMIGRRWSAASAGALGFMLTAGIAVVVFGFGLTTHTDLNPGYAIGGALTEALFMAAAILWIILPALCIFELQHRTGAFDVIREGLTYLSTDRRISALLVGWFFALFMEGAAGFGTPVALAAPILVGLGFAPVQAVTMVLIGHAAGVSFGAVGTPILAQVAATAFTGIELARGTGVMHAALGTILLIFLYKIAGEGAPLPVHGRSSQWGWMCVAAPCFLLPFLLFAMFIGPELPTLAGALVGGGIFIWMLRWKQRAKESKVGKTKRGIGAAMWRASLPYVVLLALVLATRLITPLQQILQGVVWKWSLFDVFSGSIQPYYHPGTMLAVGFVVGGLIQGHRLTELGIAIVSAARRALPAVIALVAMLSLSRVMVHAGMITALAESATFSLGPVWPLVVPAVGAFGSFITGSATASNILLTNFQEAAARTLGLPPAQLVSAQGFGAAVGNVICPHNVIAGAATVGLQGREGEVLRRTILPCICYAAAGGVLLFALLA